MMTLKEKKALLKTLENAYNTCFECGETKRITESRDFAYFITGIRKLKLEIQNEKSNRQTKVQQSKEPSC